MTEEERQKFFNKVKGRRIRWSGWDLSNFSLPMNRRSFFVPERRTYDVMYGTLYVASRRVGSLVEVGNRAFHINRGFRSDYGRKWYFFPGRRDFLIFG